eukprot:3670450-Pyramimonas_sp.AAC.1
MSGFPCKALSVGLYFGFRLAMTLFRVLEGTVARGVVSGLAQVRRSRRVCARRGHFGHWPSSDDVWRPGCRLRMGPSGWFLGASGPQALK